MPIVKPNLAAEGLLGHITYPIYGSFKYNGVRAFNPEGRLLSRTLKDIPNKYTSRLFSDLLLAGLDGELVVGDFADPNVFSNSTSGVMSQDGEPDVRWYVFDVIDPEASFRDRRLLLEKLSCGWGEWEGRVVLVTHRLLTSDEEVSAMHREAVSLGYEGLVLRSPDSKYKFGRSTAAEQGFMRFCDWMRSEAVILEVIEGQTNTNEAKKNALGRTERSSHQAGMKPTGTAGAIRVYDPLFGEFNMQLGTDEECAWFWTNRETVVGQMMKYKYRPPVKVGGKPRFPIPEGLRHPDDMS